MDLNQMMNYKGECTIKGGKALFNAILAGMYDNMSMLYELLGEIVLHRNRLLKKKGFSYESFMS